MTRPSHAALVEEVAEFIGEKVGADCNSRDIANGIFEFLAFRLSDVTLEMVEAVAEAIHQGIIERNKVDIPWDHIDAARQEDFRDDARAAISAFLAV